MIIRLRINYNDVNKHFMSSDIKLNNHGLPVPLAMDERRFFG